jgi:tol-pal system protein YbgF
MSRRAIRTTVFTLLGMLLLAGCASQQDVVTLDDRLAAIDQRNADAVQRSQQSESRLEEYIKLQEQKELDFRHLTASQKIMIKELREEIRSLRGELEETQYLIKRKVGSLDNSKGKRTSQLDRMEQLLSSNKDRIVRIEQYLNLETTELGSTLNKAPDATVVTSPAKTDSADDIYATAKQGYDQNNFEDARERFQQFLTRYPKSEHADNAQFWIGETYYREKWYEKAILEYQKVIEQYPNGNKVPASLLKQGFAFSKLGDQANARLIFAELVKKYPKSNEAKIAKQKIKALKP